MCPYQARHFVMPDLGPNCLQKLSADDQKVISTMTLVGKESNLYAIMDSSFSFGTINLGRSILYIEGSHSQIIISHFKAHKIYVCAYYSNKRISVFASFLYLFYSNHKEADV